MCVLFFISFHKYDMKSKLCFDVHNDDDEHVLKHMETFDRNFFED